MAGGNAEREAVGDFSGDVFGDAVLGSALVAARLGLRGFCYGNAAKPDCSDFDTVATNFN
jgi:hypothetical protein